MGNTPSVHQQRNNRGTSAPLQEHSSSHGRHHHTKFLAEAAKERQNSITSQLFPSRKGRHTAAGIGNIKRGTRSAVPHSPSLFKKDYSLKNTSAGAGAGAGADGSGDARTPSAESVRANMAVLTLKNSEEGGGPVANPYFLSPGPATPTVQPTKEEAIPLDDTEFQGLLDHRQSVVALKKTLQETEQLSSPSASSASASSSNFGTRSNSIDIRIIKGKTPHNSVDTDFDSSDADNNSDDGYLQSKDIVLNQSLVHSVLKRDMKRKRGKEISGPSSVDDMAAIAGVVAGSKDGTLKPGENGVHRSSMISESQRGRNGLSYESIDSGHLPEIKKLKPISHDILLPHCSEKDSEASNQFGAQKQFHSLDSFEKGSVEHREVEDQNRKSSPLSSTSSSGTSQRSQASQEVRVIIKWRDAVPHGMTTRISMVSEDIASTLSFERQKPGAHNTFSMEFDPKSKEWYVPDLVLPAGIYRLQFLVNGEIRHSDYLPTATDSVGNFVNWFEVVPGYKVVEPYREEVDTDAKGLSQDDTSQPSASTSHAGQGTTLLHPIPDKAQRPPLVSSHHSSNRMMRSNTPHSDYTGISRSSSALRKSPLMECTSSSLDLVTALQPKKYQYSNEIPELFKTMPESDVDNDDMTVGRMDASCYGWSHFQKVGANGKVVDCNQDELFTHLQQGGLLDADTAEQLFLDKYPVPDLPIYLNSYYLNKILSEFQKNNYPGFGSSGVNHIIPHVNLNHLLTSSIRDEMISVGCTTRYEGKFITQVIYSPCYYERCGMS